MTDQESVARDPCDGTAVVGVVVLLVVFLAGVAFGVWVVPMIF